MRRSQSHAIEVASVAAPHHMPYTMQVAYPGGRSGAAPFRSSPASGSGGSRNHLNSESSIGPRSHLSSESSIASDISSVSGSSVGSVSSSKGFQAFSSSLPTPPAFRNWWCNSCRRPREECECLCVVS